MAEVEGSCDPAFHPVLDAFEENFAEGEIGAACCVEIGGRVVLDVWGGWADAEGTRMWRRDTLVNTYSVGKPIVALMLLQCVARGDVALDSGASTVWPECRAAQQGATIRHVLSHRAGVPAIRMPLTNDDLWNWEAMCAAIAASEPWWTPGTRHTYHTNTYGHLVGELGRRLDHRLPGSWLHDEIAGPLAVDLAWGLDVATQQRCADVVWQGGFPPDTASIVASDLSEEQKMVMLGYVNPPGYSSLGVVNTPEWRTAQVPSTNLHATATGIARLYSALAAGGAMGGVRVIDSDMLAEATTPQSDGWCPVLERDVTFGLGFQLTRPDRPLGPNPGSFGHFGTGGALGFADPVAGAGFGYVMNAVKPRWQSPRNRRLIDALYSCL